MMLTGDLSVSVLILLLQIDNKHQMSKLNNSDLNENINIKVYAIARLGLTADRCELVLRCTAG